MTAFAAVLSLSDNPASVDSLRSVAQILSRVAGRPAKHVAAGRCVLWLAPLHRSDPNQPVVGVRTGTVVAGQATLDGKRELARILRATEGTQALDLIAASQERWPDCFTDYLSGEYAFAVWNPRIDRLVCAVDGLGVRQLYAAETRQAVVVSNVIDAVLAHASVADEYDGDALLEFLSSGCISDPVRTAYQGVRAIPAGHTLTFNAGSRARSLRRHWRMPAPDVMARCDDEVLEGYRDVLSRATAERIEDGPATLLLSGGIDSTSIAAAAVDAGKHSALHAVTIRYRHLTRQCEAPLAREAAEALDIPLSEVEGDLHLALAAEDDVASPCQPIDEPMLADWRSVMQEASRHGTIVLNGEDGDALFSSPGGAELLRGQSVAAVAWSVGQFLARTRRLPYLGVRLRERMRVRPNANHVVPPDWLTLDAIRLLQARQPADVMGCRPTPLPDHPTHSDAQRRLTTNVRPFAEAISAAVTLKPLEIRLPLMDSRVISYVFSLPPIPWCQRKHLPRAAYAGRLPESILRRPKTGVVGANDALVRRWREARRSDRFDCVVVPRDWIDRSRWTRSVFTGGTHEAMAAWRVLMLDAWMARRLRSGTGVCTA